MKRFKCLIMLFALISTCSMINACSTDMKETVSEIEINIQTGDTLSEEVLKKCLFDDSKIQKYDNYTDGISASTQLQQNNIKMKKGSEDGLYVDNCVMVISSYEIAFDTSKVIDAVFYTLDDHKHYYIQYETVEDAKKATEILKQYISVDVVERDGIAALFE